MVFEASLVWAAVAVWAALGVYVSVTDLREAIISRRACWAAGSIIVGLLAAAAVATGDPLRLVWSVTAAASVAGLFEVIYRRWPSKVGYGDVRLIIVNSLLVGWWGISWVWWALFAGALAEWPVAMVAVVRHGRNAQVRWAPGLVAGTAAILIWRLWAEGPVGT